MKTLLKNSMFLKCQLFIYSHAGLVINPLYPYLGATPDGFVYCDCCGYGVLEIKSPLLWIWGVRNQMSIFCQGQSSIRTPA